MTMTIPQVKTFLRVAVVFLVFFLFSHYTNGGEPKKSVVRITTVSQSPNYLEPWKGLIDPS